MVAEDLRCSPRITLSDRLDQRAMLSMTLAGDFCRKAQAPNWLADPVKCLDESSEHAVAARQSDLVMQLEI